MDYNKPFDQTNPAAGYVNGNPATNTAGSIPCAEGLEYPQREIVNVIKAADLVPTNGDLTQLLQAVSILALRAVTGSGQVPVIPASPLLYVSTTGNDATGDGSLSKPFATILAACAYAKAKYYLAGLALTIQLAPSATPYAPPGNVDAGGGTINIVGDAANAGAYPVQGPGPAGGASGLIASTNGSVNVTGVTITNTGTTNSCVAATGANSLSTASVTFNTTQSGSPALIASFAGASITIRAGCVLNGYAQAALLMSGGTISQAANIALTNTPVYAAAFAVADTGGVFRLTGGFGFTGTGATCAKFLQSTFGVFNTNGAGQNFFPGNSAGSLAQAGSYV
jgi:hypothetical protein